MDEQVVAGLLMQSEDEKFMARALRLAEKGEGKVSPNPLVGAVIVKGGKIIVRTRGRGGKHIMEAVGKGRWPWWKQYLKRINSFRLT